MSKGIDNTIYYSRCGVGKGKWFWIAKLGDDYFGGGDPFAFGYANTSEDAEGQALKASKGKAPEKECIKVQNYSAAFFKRCLVAKEKAERKADSSDAAPREFLYVDYESDYGNYGCTPYQIVKKTNKRVYVLDDRHSHSYGDWRDYAYQKAIVLDRVALERDGSAWSRTKREIFHTTPREERQKAFIPKYGELLGLTPPWNKEQVKEAFRKRVREAHPNTGGSPDAFKELYEAYSKAMEMAS